MEIISAQGHRRWVRTHGEPVRDPSGKIVKVEGAIQDITRHKTADAERERLQAQLAQLQKIESVGRLAGGVAHDFNNMLQVILGHADFALERLAAGESVEDDLQEIRRAATRSADLTRQLLAYARKQTIAPRILNLNETIAGMLQMLRRLIGEHIRLIWQPHVDLAPIRMDPSQLDQILANLCVNARDAITGAGTVTIRTRHAVIGPAEIARHPEQHPGDYICLSVTDDGAGMEPEVVAQLFEPFFTTKNVGRGIGLGLATIYGIVRQNGGFIDVNSQPGQGSCFRIFLPKHKIADLAPPMLPQPATPPGQETILLVEDDPGILTICKSMIECLGYRVLAAARPNEAIQRAESTPGDIQLLITDVVLPEMNGRALAQILLARQPHLKILFMSGYTADVIAHHGVLEDDIRLLCKPFTLNKLGNTIREVLDS